PVYHAQELAAGANPLTWTPHIGTDFDPWRSDGRVPYLLAALAIRLGLAGTAAIRLTLALALALGAWGMYVWARRRLSVQAALVAALAYTFLPTTLSILYVRGAVGEAWIWALAPWLLWGITAGLKGSCLGQLVMAIAVALLLWSQAGLAILAIVPAALLLLVMPGKRARTAIALAAGIAIGLLGLIPWLRTPGVGPNPAYGDHFLYLFQLLLPQWGHGVSQKGWQDTLSFQVGAIVLGLALLSAYGWWSRESNRPSGHLISLAWGVVLALSLLTLGFTAPLWRITGMSRLLTYPWQLLVIVAPWVSLLAGSAIDLIPSLDARPRWAALVGLVILVSYPYLAPRYTQIKPRPRPVAILGENQIALVDAEVTGEIRASSTVTVTLTWQALKPMDLDYTVFIHIVDEQNQIKAQRDKQPQDGQHPTNAWSVGEIVIDPHPIPLPADLPTGRYHINLGMYDWRTGQRLRVGDTNFVRLEP
ncbi:MAG: hypothetical protein J7M34_11220, partial [Anaerolineae bacterium]|nr:hypothetical protein [Anaerolineae bacterium]